MQADKAYERNVGPPGWKNQVTVLIEVGWTQALGPVTNGTTLLGNVKDWFDIGASPLVLIVKLYGSTRNQNPGMMVALVTNEGVIRVVQAGEIANNDSEYFRAYNEEYAGGNVPVVGRRGESVPGQYQPRIHQVQQLPRQFGSLIGYAYAYDSRLSVQL
jgi:hypothetical protein